MEEKGILSIGRTGVFTLRQAQEVLPLVKRITTFSSRKVESLIVQLESLDDYQTELKKRYADEANNYYQEWGIKIKKLGAEPQGLWLVDFDSGEGYFCWKYPEPSIMYWHSYLDGFSNRIPIDEWKARKLIPKTSNDMSHSGLTI